MRVTAEYLQHAIACRELSERTTRLRDKKVLEELARAWQKIAALREQDLKIAALGEQDLIEANDRADVR